VKQTAGSIPHGWCKSVKVCWHTKRQTWGKSHKRRVEPPYPRKLYAICPMLTVRVTPTKPLNDIWEICRQRDDGGEQAKPLPKIRCVPFASHKEFGPRSLTANNLQWLLKRWLWMWHSESTPRFLSIHTSLIIQ